jgi:hypothetical protein
LARHLHRRGGLPGSGALVSNLEEVGRRGSTTISPWPRRRHAIDRARPCAASGLTFGQPPGSEVRR